MRMTFNRGWLWLLPFLVAPWLGAMEYDAEKEAALEQASNNMPLIRSITLFLLAGLALAFVAAVIYVARRIRDRRSEEDRAALQFELQMGTFLAGRQAAPSGASIAPAALAPFSPVEPVNDPKPVTANSPQPDAADSVFEKLRAAGLMGSIEGMVYLSDGTTEARIVRLKNGKAALVMPRAESGEFLARQLKRFDLCIIPLGGDSISVAVPLGAYIADHFSL